MKKILLAIALALMAPFCFGQSYPSPTYHTITLQLPLSVSNGGTNAATASGTSLDNITGFSGTGLLNRTGAGAYSFVSLTNGIPLTALAQQAANTVLANVSGSTANVSAFSMPSCSGSYSNLQYTTNSGFTCGLVNIPTVATIAALQAATSGTLPQSVVYVQGYAANSDGGENIFTVGTTTTANGCTIFNDASGRSWYREGGISRTINVKWCGAKGDGSTNDAPSIQSAINLVQSYALPFGTVYIPQGSYAITTALNVTNGITIQGDAQNDPRIFPTATINAINVNTANAFTLKNVIIWYTTPQNSGLWGITVTSPSGANSNSLFRDVQITQAYNGIQLAQSALFTVDHCFIQNTTGQAIQVSDAQDIDVGDGTVINSTIFNYGTYQFSGTGIAYLSGGGLRVANNKFGALNYGVQLNYATNAGSSTTGTAQLTVTGNSFDSMGQIGVLLQRQTNTDVFNTVVIANNNFPDTFFGVDVPADANGTWLTNLVVTGNIFILPGTSGTTGVVINSTTNFNVTNNSFNNGATNGTGISVGTSAAYGVVAGNNLISTVTAWGTIIFNGSTTTVVKDNLGYNPVGRSSLSPGASPWTYTNGASPAEIFLSASSQLTSVQTSGGNTLPQPAGANVPFTIELSPFQAVTVTYSGSLTANAYVH